MKSEPMRTSGQSKRELQRCIGEFRVELERRFAAELEEQKKEERQDELDRMAGLDPSLRGTTFPALADKWYSEERADKGAQFAPSTLQKDTQRLDSCKDYFHGVDVRAIDVKAVRGYQRYLLNERMYSGTTAHGHFQTFNAVMNWAVVNGYIASNPCDKIKNIPKDTEEKDALSPREISHFVALLDASTHPRPSMAGFRLALMAGLRCGECCAVTWGDIDFEAGTIHVHRSLCSRTLQLKETKTKNGDRVIPLDSRTLDWMRRFRTQQATELLRLGKNVNDFPIVAKADADYMHPCNLSRSLGKFLKANGFRHITFHQLRHSYCTQLFEAGADVDTVMHLMGHGDASTTLNIYNHFRKNDSRRAAKAVEALAQSLPESNVKKLETPRGRWGIMAVSA